MRRRLLALIDWAPLFLPALLLLALVVGVAAPHDLVITF